MAVTAVSGSGFSLAAAAVVVIVVAAVSLFVLAFGPVRHPCLHLACDTRVINNSNNRIKRWDDNENDDDVVGWDDTKRVLYRRVQGWVQVAVDSFSLLLSLVVGNCCVMLF